ncbi:unnamed protein product [Zymoseptoria tritici ST99CH_1E4]|uniref:DUF6589 domain-containing protein n=1 Tax=Zymoseptoria tritici ST99CH_1E4 TaxID=1276532 RepID=A0A2H1H8Q7_ZYMTR|nr:unnamed protein product [Zymoseptoria tritici ST99CH_1E4]
MCRLLQEVELFLTVGLATRNEDIGHMRRLVDRLTISFLGAGQSNYSREIIYLRWLLSEALDLKLQTGILASSVINQSGKRSKAVATDKMLELDNVDYNYDIKQHGNSTHTLAQTFKRVSLAAGIALLLPKVQDFNVANQRFARGVTSVVAHHDGEEEDLGEFGEPSRDGNGSDDEWAERRDNREVDDFDDFDDEMMGGNDGGGDGPGESSAL